MKIDARRAGCLLFDYGGTLDSDGVAWKERFHRLYCVEGVNLTVEDFAKIFYRADDALVGKLAPNIGLTETVERLVGNVEQGLALFVEEDPRRGGRIARHFLGDTQATLLRNRPVLDSLRARSRLGIVSNFYGNLPGVCRELEIDSLFDTIIDSEIVGVSKPSPGIFKAATEALGVSPDETVMIGDSLARDGEGARLAGLGFIWIASPITAAEKSYDCRVIRSVTELAELQ